MKRIRKILLLMAFFGGMFAVYAFTPNWRIYWNTKSGKQKSATCVFGIPIAFGKIKNTALSDRLKLKNSGKGEWVIVASGRPIEHFDRALISWCYPRVESAIGLAESSVRLARLHSDNHLHQREDSQRMALQFLEELERTHDICDVTHRLREFSDALCSRNFDMIPFQDEELDQIFTDNNSLVRTSFVGPDS